MRTCSPRSSPRLPSLAFAVAALATAHARAQATLTVGPGGYAQISAAIAAAQPGDVIEVAPGAYLPFDLTIGVRIIAPAGATVIPAAGGTFSRQVSAPVGQRAELVGIAFRSFSYYPPAIWPVNLTINGHVSFADCSFSAINADFTMPLTVCNGDIQFDRCTFEALDDCLVVNGGHVQLNECTLRGVWSSYNPPPARAIAMGSSQVDVFSCDLRGAPGTTDYCPGSAAIEVFGAGRLRLRDSVVTGGNGYLSCAGASGVVNHSQVPVEHARTTIVGGGGGFGVQAPPISGLEQTAPLTGGAGPTPPGLGLLGGPEVGAPYSATVIGPMSALVAIGLSFERAAASALPSIAQPVHFDPASVILYQWGVASAPLPAWPGYATYDVQTVSLTPAMSGFEFWLHPLVWDGAAFQVGPVLGGVVR